MNTQAKIIKEQAKILKAQKVIKEMQDKILKSQKIIKAQEKIAQEKNINEPIELCRGCGCEGNYVGDCCECKECWWCREVFTVDPANWEKYPDYCPNYCEECNKIGKRC